MNKSDASQPNPVPDGLMEYLAPDLIYRFNQTFIAAWKQAAIGYLNEEKIAFFTLSYYNSYTRTFNWVSIAAELWRPYDERCTEWDTAFNKLKDFLEKWNNKDDENGFNTSEYCEREKAWKDLWKDFPKGGIYNTAEKICKGLNFDGEFRGDRLQRAMLGLYSGIHFEEEKNIEGIFVEYLKCLEKKREDALTPQMNYLSGTLMNFREDNDQRGPFDWLKLDEEFVSDSGPKRYQNIRDPNPSSSSDCKPSNTNPPKAEGVQELGEKLFTELLLEPSNSYLSKELANRKIVVLVPIYDVWIETEESFDVGQGKKAYLSVGGFGCIKAVVLCFFKNINDRDDWLVEKLPLLLSQLSTVSSGIIESSKATALSQPIEPPYDLLRHFIKILTYVQDWESAYVVDTTKDKVLFCYKRCYKRKEKLDSPIVDWKAEEDDTHPSLCDSSTIQQDGNRFFMWWTKDLWSKDLIFSLGDEEYNAFSRFAICFEFPEACHIPTDTELQKRMRSTYLRQQLDLMNLLIPKVQMRRAALRSALSAIMGRNMSHNIGSHVIARYAAVVGNLDEQREYSLHRDVEDHRTVFLRYLQRRMDFIAEVSTSDKPNWSQPLGLVEVLESLNFKKAKERINGGDETKSFKPILLSYITGKENISTSVEIVSDTKEYFNCPSGEVGAHALYVILENVIRNSARHNTGIKEVVLEVEVTDSEYPELLKLEIKDCQTVINQNNKEKANEPDQTINKIILEQPFLSPDGSPNPKNWGIREMQICAQHLRGLPLSDLETRSVDPPVLKAIQKQDRLAYELYLQRPKLCAIVADEICCELRGSEEALKKMGIALFDQCPEDLTKLRGYDFIVLSKCLEEDELSESDKRQKLQLPLRTLYVKKKTISSLLEKIKSWVKDDNEYKPADLCNPLHRHLWENRYKRGCWRDKQIEALVSWDASNWPKTEESEKYEIRSGSGSNFLHTVIDSAPYKKWEKGLQGVGLVWVDHAQEKMFSVGHNPEFINAVEGGEYDPIIFSETFMSISLHKPVLKEQMEGMISGDELIAAALARVIVLDERVQSLEDKKYRDIPYNILWPCMGIWTPSAEDNNLNNPDLNSIKCFLSNPTKKSDQLPADFLVLHLTILEDLSSQNDKTPQEILNELRDCCGVGKACEVVIVSGRGIPSATINSAIEQTEQEKELNERFLPISALLEHISQPSKLALMRSLWSA